MGSEKRVSTGFKGLDEILDELRLGDNVVWSVDKIDDYRSFVLPYVEQAIKDKRNIVYMRFGQHDPILAPHKDITVYELEPRRGFEHFATRIHSIITKEGIGAFYVFDCLSDLLSAWATDLMIGNFFKVTCPYLFELDTVAYFALIRGRHSHRTITRIQETTQLLLNLYNYKEDIYVHPLKVWERKSPTMFLPHKKQGDSFIPMANSYDATRLLTEITGKTADNARRQLDHWHRLFLQAEEIASDPSADAEQQQMVGHICKHMIGRDERILELARNYFSLKDLLKIKGRMIGTGFIGGKAVGMLLAREILLRDTASDWGKNLESHDSFFVGSNVYYSYIVHNGWWKTFMQQKTEDGYFSAAAELREKMLEGTFPDMIRQQFRQMLEYFGQYPIIVRSSSLLEDGFGNAFAGKYDSFFRVNQGTPEQRLEQFEEAVKMVFASAMSEDALAYRKQRGLDKKEEKMSLLVQRVSGSYRKHFYFPELAGVGVSYNTFVWDKDMDPKAGMLRLVFGLGTRAVDRVEGDYPRIVALDAPLKKPHAGFEDTRKFSQRDVDLLNINENSPQTISLFRLLKEKPGVSLDLYGVKDYEAIRRLEERGRKGEEAWLLTFDKLLSETSFTELMQKLLKTLEKAYKYPVDVEFTVNFDQDDTPKINVVQCRPLQTKGEKTKVDIPEKIDPAKIFIQSQGNFMGGSIMTPIKRIISVDGEQYNRLSLSEKYEVARLVGRLNKRIKNKKEIPTLLLGPGRWGTSTPTLGVPVTFSEINNITALAEVAFPSGGLMPELSFGSHFFQDLVEADIFYMAVFPENKNCTFDKAWLDNQPNELEGMMPASSRYKRVVKVYKAPGEGLQLMADVVSQKLLCYR